LAFTSAIKAETSYFIDCLRMRYGIGSGELFQKDESRRKGKICQPWFMNASSLF